MKFNILHALPLANLAFAMPSSEIVGASGLEYSSLFARTNGNSFQPEPQPDAKSCPTSNGTSTFGQPFYTEPYRNQIHFSPTASFMNDPNGLVYRAESKEGADDALWIMNYQYAYNQTTAGNQHWGVATSKDLWKWTHHPPGIAPGAPGEGIFSGSSVVDVDNTSGFFNSSIPPSHRIVAIYTLNTPESQTQQIAYSLDGGLTFIKYENNPVLAINQTQFRDPKVFWDAQTKKWIMPVSLSQHYQIIFYASPDLKSWTELSRFSTAGILGYQYECPGLFQVPVKGGPKDGQLQWVLWISINPGGISQGGSFIQYYIGDWDGTKFTAYDAAARLTEWGPDSYAAQTWSNTPGDTTTLISWASNWLYSQFVPTNPWRSAFTVAREARLQYYPQNPQDSAYVFAQEPIDTSPIRGRSLLNAPGSNVGNQSVSFDKKQDTGGFDFNVTFTSPDISKLTRESFGSVSFYNHDKSQHITVGVLMGIPAQVYIDRRHATTQFADTTPFFVDRFSTILMPTLADPNSATSAATVKLRTILDKSLLELFAQDGASVATASFFFDKGSAPASATISAHDDSVQVGDVSAVSLKSTWECFVKP